MDTDIAGGIGGISIHAPREGGDSKMRGDKNMGVFISIHAPREGGDRAIGAVTNPVLLFQSTPPARGATVLMP